MLACWDDCGKSRAKLHDAVLSAHPRTTMSERAIHSMVEAHNKKKKSKSGAWRKKHMESEVVDCDEGFEDGTVTVRADEHSRLQRKLNGLVSQHDNTVRKLEEEKFETKKKEETLLQSTRRIEDLDKLVVEQNIQLKNLQRKIRRLSSSSSKLESTQEVAKKALANEKEVCFDSNLISVDA